MRESSGERKPCERKIRDTDLDPKRRDGRDMGEMGDIHLGALSSHFSLLLYPLVLSQTKKGIGQEIKEGVHRSVCETQSTMRIA